MTSTELRTRRKRLVMTQAQLAAEMDVTVTTVARWEIDESKPTHVDMPRMAIRLFERIEQDHEVDATVRGLKSEMQRQCLPPEG
jgi:transcriptional regulator with XRE-family HTH domain